MRTLQVEKPQSAGRQTAQEIFPPTVGPGRIEMPTHPAMPRLHAGRLRFAPAPADDTDDADRPVGPARLSCRRDWIERVFEIGWVGLIVACAAECAWRLL